MIKTELDEYKIIQQTQRKNYCNLQQSLVIQVTPPVLHCFVQ